MPRQQILRLLLSLSLILTGTLATARPAAAQVLDKLEAGADVNFVRANAPPAECGCFSAYGSSATLAFNVTPHFAAVGQFGAVHTSNATSTGLDLTIASYLAGGRYTYRVHESRLMPYGQVLAGVAHAGGGLAPSNQISGSSSIAFAGLAGGGLQLLLTPRFILRVPEVDYFVTTFPNNVNHHQNNLRVSAGVTYRFGK